ncbi:hypothetical protein QNM99_19425 [Pseudomonas sp. PCH446]
MYKVTPNPPGTSGIESIDPKPLIAPWRTTCCLRAAVQNALVSQEYKASPGATKPRRSPRQCELNTGLRCATAYENADNLTGANRKVAMGVVHLIELAQRQVDSVIEDQPAGITN